MKERFPYSKGIGFSVLKDLDVFTVSKHKSNIHIAP